MLVHLLGGDLIIEVEAPERSARRRARTGSGRPAGVHDRTGGRGLAPANCSDELAAPAGLAGSHRRRRQRQNEEADVRFSRRMDNLAPYLFAEMERKIAEKRKSGVDVISLGIGDPDLPTPAYIVEEMQRQVADPANDRYPSNWGHPGVRRGGRRPSTSDGSASTSTPRRSSSPSWAPRRGWPTSAGRMLDAGRPGAGARPGLSRSTRAARILAGAEVRYLRLRPEKGFLPDLDEISEEEARRAKVLFIGYPNNPTAAVIEDDFFERVVAFAKQYDIAVVHDNAYSELTYDGYVAPSFLATPGAKDVGVEFFSFSKPFNMTGWRTGFAVGNHEILAHLWRLKTNMDSGMFDALQRTSAFILNGPWDFVARDVRGLPPPARPAGRGPDLGGHAGAQAQGDHLHVDTGARGLHVGRIQRARARPGRGRGHARARATARPERGSCGCR